MRAIAFRKSDTTVTHCIRLKDTVDFLHLFALCASIKVYYYSEV